MKLPYLTPSLEVYELQAEGCIASSSVDETTIEKLGEEEFI